MIRRHTGILGIKIGSLQGQTRKSDRLRSQLGAVLIAFTRRDDDGLTDAIMALGVARHRVDVWPYAPTVQVCSIATKASVWERSSTTRAA